MASCNTSLSYAYYTQEKRSRLKPEFAPSNFKLRVHNKKSSLHRCEFMLAPSHFANAPTLTSFAPSRGVDAPTLTAEKDNR